MKALLKFDVEVDLPTDDPEEAELLGKELAYTKYRIGGLKYRGLSISPEIDYQMQEIKRMGLLWDELMSHFKV